MNRASRSAGETDKVAATRVNGWLQHVTATQTQTTVPSETKPPSPARQRSASVARLAASPAGPSRSSSSSKLGHLTKIPALPTKGEYHRIRFCTCSPEYDDEETTSSAEDEEDDGDPDASFSDWVSL